LWGLGQVLPVYGQPDSLQAPPDTAALRQAQLDALAWRDSMLESSRRDTAVIQKSWEKALAWVKQAEAQADTAVWLEALRHARLILRRQRRYTAHDSMLQLEKALKVAYGYDTRALWRQLATDPDKTRMGLVERTRILRDSSGKLTPAAILTGLDSLPFQLDDNIEGELAAFEGAYWIVVRLRHETDRGRNQFFAVGRELSGWDTVDVYLYGQGQLLDHARTGDAVPAEARSIPTSPSTVQLYLPDQEALWVLVRLAGPNQEDPPVRVRLSHVSYFAYAEDRAQDRFVNGIFQGIVLIQLMYFLLFFISTRDAIYGNYVLYILGLSIFIVTSNYVPEYIPLTVIDPGYLYLLAVWLACIGLYRFSAAYLNFQEHLPGWIWPSRVMQILLTGMALIMAVGIGIRTKQDMMGIIIIGAVGFLLALFIVTSLIFMFFWGIQALNRGYRPARFYLLASIFLILGMVIPITFFFVGAFMQDVERFIDEDTVTTVMQGGIALQLSLFALAVGNQRNQLEKEKRDALQENLAIQQKINSATARFVPYEFLHSLGHDSILDVHLGDQVEKEVTVFFSDIRGYTTLSEQMTPRENFRFLNAYLGRVGPIIKANRGFVNQYFGDGVMALFMPPEPGVSSPRDAVEAAIQIQETLRVYNAERVLKGRQPIQTGIGLHSGPLMLGVIGDTLRMDVGVVSDTVNTAARMEGLTKYYGAALITSEFTLAGIPNPEDFAYRYLGQVLVKGKVAPLGIYEFLAADTPEQAQRKADTSTAFAEALQAYFDRDFETAVKGFSRVIQHNPEDKAAHLYLQRALQARDQGVSKDWTGVETMLSK
ncbi:MAG: hypothetical protein D6722_12825, partial [Bacteroidetes bacterium]